MKSPTLQDDPNIKMPAAVRAQVARSEEIIRQINGTENLTSEGNEEQPPTEQPLGEQQFQTDTQQPEPKPEAKSKAEPDEESWAHKYKSVHGRFLRSQEEVRDLSEQVRNLQSVIASMEAAPVETSSNFSGERLITDDEARDYGEDFLNVVGKKAKEEISPLIKAYQAELAEMKRQLAGVTTHVEQDSKDKLIETLDERLPNWRALNTNPNFLEWLRLPDPFSGAKRHDMLKAAYTQGNPSRVLAFFNGFLAEEAAVDPARDEPETGTQRVAKIPLETLAAPGRAKSAAGTSAPAEKPIFTRANIAAFYADVANGKYRGREADKEKLERQLFDAQREGRIR